MACRCRSFLGLMLIFSSQSVLGARRSMEKLDEGGKLCQVTERAFSGSDDTEGYGVSYSLRVKSCFQCNLHMDVVKDLSPILSADPDPNDNKRCTCWGKAAEGNDVWSKFFDFKLLGPEKCDWKTCWKQYGRVLTKRKKAPLRGTDRFDSMSHWEASRETCIDGNNPSLSGPTIGEVIADIVKDDPGPKDGGEDKPAIDLGPIEIPVVPESKMKDEDEILQDEFDEEEEELDVEEDNKGDVVEEEEVITPPKPKTKPEYPDCPHTWDVCNCMANPSGSNPPTGPGAWEKNAFSENAADIATCICNLENENGWAKADQKCMGRTMQLFKAVGRFGCKLQRFKDHGNKRACIPHYPGKDVTGAIARASRSNKGD